MNSEDETEKSISGESTVEESPKEKSKKKKQPPSSKPKKNTSGTNASKQTNNNEEIVHPKLGKLPFKTTGEVNSNGEEIYCTCRKIDNGDLMVACDGCDDWYHFKCVKISIKYQHLVASYFCPYCELEGKGTTLWKRRCRLSNCFKPISGNESKYCSKDHGTQFIRSIIDQLPEQAARQGSINKSQLVEIVTFSSDYEQFKRLGDSLPNADIDFDEDSRVKRINEKISNLKSTREIEIRKKRALIKARENIEKLNERLRAADTTAPSSKKKIRKIDICGYDTIFRTDGVNFDEENLHSNDINSLVKKFQEVQDNDGCDTEVCLLEKKRCLKHNGWQSIINDEIALIIGNIETETEKLQRTKEKLIQTLKIDHFEANRS